MRKALYTAVVALALSVVPAKAQQTAPITVGTVNCGITTLSNLHCYSLPITVNNVSGTAWVSVSGQGGFIMFRPGPEGANYVEAAITSVTVNQRNSIGQPTQVTITFTINSPSLNGYSADPDNNSDADVVMGSMTLNGMYTTGKYIYCTVTGGSGAQSITQD